MLCFLIDCSLAGSCQVFCWASLSVGRAMSFLVALRYRAQTAACYLSSKIPDICNHRAILERQPERAFEGSRHTSEYGLKKGRHCEERTCIAVAL